MLMKSCEAVTDKLVHVSEVTRSELLGPDGKRLGRIVDLIVWLDSGKQLPSVCGAKARIGGQDLFVPVGQIARFEAAATRMSRTARLAPFERRAGEALLRGDLLDRSLIHVTAARIVRAWEIELVCQSGAWRVVGIDTSVRARLRRLLTPRWRRRSREPVRFVPWSELEPFVGHLPSAQRRTALRRLATLHPAQIADLVEASPHDQGEEILHAVEDNPDLEANVFEELDDEHRAEFLRDRPDTEVAVLLATLASDDAADLLMQLEQQRRTPVLDLLPAARRTQVRRLLRYNPETAGGIMSPDFVQIVGTASVADAIAAVRSSEIPGDELRSVYVSDHAGQLTGAVAVADLLRGPATASLASLVRANLATVSASADIPEIACVMSDYDLLALPVVDQRASMIGVVALDDLIERILPEDWRRRHRAMRT